VVLLGALLSLGIEAAQLYIPGRAPTVRDIAANALGAGLGWLIAVRLASWVDRWRATRIALAFGVLTPAAAVALNSWLLMPYVAPVPLWGQWAPDLGRLERWTGRVHAVLLGAQPIAIGRLSPDPDTVRAIRAALERRANVRVSLTFGAVPAGRAPIVGIADARSEHLLLVSQDGADLVIQRFVRGSQLRLETPVDRIHGLFNGRAPGDSTTLELTWADGRSCATIDERAVCAEPSHGQRLWVYLLWNASEHRWLEVLLDVLTSALLWLPLAWIIPQRGRSYVLVPLGVAVGLSVGAHLIAPVGMLTIADVSGGLLAGVFAWRSERRRTVRAAG
jgi:aryl carrier-like protein